MAAKKKSGLGRGLNDILAEEGRIGANREMRQLIPTDVPPSIEKTTLSESEFNLFGLPGKLNLPSVRDNETPAIRELRDSGELGYDTDNSTQYVGDARPPENNYGQGPDRSTRVASHKFVPYPAEKQYLMDKAGLSNNAVNELGTVYVKFHKRGDVYKYNHVPQSVYNSFANSTSKGRFINDFLNSYKYGRIGSRSDRNNADDL